MSQITQIYFCKLSDPVDTLDIGRKACRALQRAGITTVAEILLAGKPKLNSIKNVGPNTVADIWRAATGYLHLSEGQLVKLASQLERTGRDARGRSIAALPLPASTLEALWSTGVYQIDELIQSRTLGYCKLPGMEAGKIAEIDQALRSHMSGFALDQLLPQIGTIDMSALSHTDTLSVKHPDLILQLPGIPEQHWSILELAAMQLLRLEAIGARAGGISEDRVRNIIKQAQEELHHRLGYFSIFLDHFEEQSKILESNLGDGPLDLKTLVHHLLPDPLKSNLIIEEREVLRMVLLIRTLVLYKNDWFWQELEPGWRTFFLLCCLVAPDLKEHVEFERMFRKQKPEWKKDRYTKLIPSELVVSILSQVGKPLHWSSIMEQASQADGCGRFSPQELLDHLYGNEDRFVRVGPGTYGLAEWGSQTPEPDDDTIASVLRQAGRPMTREQIFDRVSAVQQASWSGIGMSLNAHPRFYKSIEDTYGLRAWLCAADGQSDPRPIWLIEDPKSCQRVE
jgi:hypothetical protein